MSANSTVPDLYYNIAECQLYGWIDSLRVYATAVSGGRAGTKTKGAEKPFLANNPFATGVKEIKGKQDGGPLPMGRYTLEGDKAKSNWIKLVPFPTNFMGGRGGFAIHGRGPIGSEGCIVPLHFIVVQEIFHAVEKRKAKGGAAPVLKVFATGDLSRWEGMA